MIKKINRATKMLLLGFSGLFLWSCESDADDLGAQFFQNDTAEGVKIAYDLVAYNISNNDTIKADGRISTSVRKDTIVLGALSDDIFGEQKANFITQLRLDTYAPTFGTNAKVDSVVMTLKPQYYTTTDKVTTTTDENYTYNSTEAKKVVSTYPMYKYGKGDNNLTIKVYEVNDFLGSVADTYYSNKSVGVGQLIGSREIKSTDKVSSVEITKKSDNTSLLSIPASIRIPLDKDFFQTKIVAKEGATELSNLSNFIRYFKGIKISVAENDGYLLKLGVSDAKIEMHYSYDGTSGTSTGKLTFDMGTSNASFSQIEYNRSGAEILGAGYDKNQGDAKLYMQGMGGNNIGLKIPQDAINQLKTQFKNDKIGILSAKMRLYVDANASVNNYTLPTAFTVMQDKKDSNGKTLYEFLSEMSSYSYNTNFNLVKGNNLGSQPAYYDITITETLKKMVESDDYQNYDFVLKLGQYLKSTSSSAYYGQNVDSRLYSPQRMVLIGSNNGQNKAQLWITYAKK